MDRDRNDRGPGLERPWTGKMVNLTPDWTVIYAPNEHSNQPAHPHSLIRVFVVLMTNFAYIAAQNAPSEFSDQTARMRRLI